MEVETMAANAEMEETLDQSTEAPLEAEMEPEETEAPQENQEESQEETRTEPGDAAGEEENHTQEEVQEQENGQDVTQTQAFAHRLREKMEPVERELQGLRETQSQLNSLQEKLKELREALPEYQAMALGGLGDRQIRWIFPLRTLFSDLLCLLLALAVAWLMGNVSLIGFLIGGMGWAAHWGTIMTNSFIYRSSIS
jgi:hypothetical protein